MSMPIIGKNAPDFELINQDGKKIKLSSFIGKNHVILYFYPKAMTPGCTEQACAMRDNSDTWHDLHAVVLGVSPDSVDQIKKFKEKEELDFDLLSDPDHKIAEAYGVWGSKKFMGKDFMGVYRTTFIIDKDGTLRHVMEDVKPKTHHRELIDHLIEIFQ